MHHLPHYITAFLLLFSLESLAQTDEIQKENLFTAGEGGYATYRIPGILYTPQGTLLAWCEARKEGGDWGAIDIMLRRSTDGGTTWTAPTVIVRGDQFEVAETVTGGASTVSGDTAGATANNPVMIADQNGRVHFLFCIEYARCFYTYSDDQGAAFAPPVDITATFEAFRPEYPWKVIATGPGHGIQLDNGRLVVPLWMSTGQFENGHRPSVVATIYSDDHGQNWQAGQIAVDHQKPTFDAQTGQPQAISDPNETAIAQLSDGRVMLNSRSESPEHFRVITTSPNGATDWSTPRFDTALYDPVCQASLIEMTYNNQDYLLFANPDSEGDPQRFGKVARARQNLTVCLSTDDGQTWPVTRVIEPGISAYSDLAAGPDGTVYLLYENGGINGNQYRSKYLTLATFTIAELTEQASATSNSQ